MLKRVRRRVQEDGPTAELEAFLVSQGYIQLRVIGTAVCGLHRFSFTTGLVVGLNFEGYERRYCYEHAADALAALAAWDGREHPAARGSVTRGRGSIC